MTGTSVSSVPATRGAVDGGGHDEEPQLGPPSSAASSAKRGRDRHRGCARGTRRRSRRYPFRSSSSMRVKTPSVTIRYGYGADLLSGGRDNRWSPTASRPSAAMKLAAAGRSRRGSSMTICPSATPQGRQQSGRHALSCRHRAPRPARRRDRASRARREVRQDPIDRQGHGGGSGDFRRGQAMANWARWAVRGNAFTPPSDK